jgi:hypothetical protein
VQWRPNDPLYGWYDLFRVDNLCGPPCGEEDLVIPDPPDPDGTWCAVAGYLTDVLHEMWQNCIDEAYAEASVSGAIALIASNLVTFAAPPVGAALVGIATLGNVFSGVKLVGAGLLEIEENPDMWDLIKCAIYTARGPDGPIIVTSAMAAKLRFVVPLALFDAGYLLNSSVIDGLLKALTDQAWRWLSLTASEGEPDSSCAVDCDTGPEPLRLVPDDFRGWLCEGSYEIIDGGDGWFTLTASTVCPGRYYYAVGARDIYNRPWSVDDWGYIGTPSVVAGREYATHQPFQWPEPPDVPSQIMDRVGASGPVGPFSITFHAVLEEE